MAKLGIIVCLALCLTSCVTSTEPEIQQSVIVADDTAYAPVYQQYSQQFEVIKNFETRYQFFVTYLTPTFLQALNERHQRIFGESRPLPHDMTESTGFFISLYSAKNAFRDLRDGDLWKIRLEVNGQTLVPSSIQSLDQKELWSTFFPTINNWSNEYLVLFKLPPMHKKSGEKQGITLHLVSGEGSVHAGW